MSINAIFRLEHRISVKPGQSVIEFHATEAHANPMGTLHGGILCDIADAAMGIAYSANLDEGESFTTLELKINFLRPVWKARLLATGRVVKQCRTVGLIECDRKTICGTGKVKCDLEIEDPGLS